MRSSRIRIIVNNSKKIESNMMEYIKKLENKSVSSKINANKYLKGNKREKAKSQLKRKKLYDSQIINTKNQIKFFKRQISEILRIQKKCICQKKK
jgi:hypothetical protein